MLLTGSHAKCVCSFRWRDGAVRMNSALWPQQHPSRSMDQQVDCPCCWLDPKSGVYLVLQPATGGTRWKGWRYQIELCFVASAIP